MISRRAVPGDRTSTLVSVAYQIALAALRPDAMYDVGRAAMPFDEKIAALAGRVAVRGDDAPELIAHFPTRFPAKVAVTAAGQTHERAWSKRPAIPDGRLTMRRSGRRSRASWTISGVARMRRPFSRLPARR